jgi:hypothetical protein
MLLRELFSSTTAKTFLFENLSKGSANVLANKGLVANVAAALRDDFSVPTQLQIKFKKLPDEEVTTWFLEQLDRMERQGYEGIVFGRNGQFNMWIAQTYAAGNDIWEDIEGEMGQALRDFTILKNRNLLDPRHADVGKFKGIKALHRYMVQHYATALQDVRQTAAMAAFIKSARSVLIADTPEYKIYYLQNRPAAVAFGKGATFCTANSNSDYNFKSYSSAAPLLGLLPKVDPKPDTTGRLGGKTFQEKFQFDASKDPRSANFRDNLDHQVDPRIIKERFPYLWDDLSKGWMANAQEISQPTEEEGIQKLQYDATKELQKLKHNLSQYWTNEKRPEVTPEAPPEGEAAPPAAPQA